MEDTNVLEAPETKDEIALTEKAVNEVKKLMALM